ncbi:hypothetical protein C8J56DRAFT_1070169 [Mycena floridula]|nr:hypothetical protein C8J56DRAFT_1070169 [Mycena floridula]
MSSVIHSELNGRLNEEEIARFKQRLSPSGLLQAAIEQLHAPQGVNETSEQYKLRLDSLRRLQDPLRYRATENVLSTSTTQAIEPILVPPATSPTTEPAVELSTVIQPLSVYDGPPSWRGPAPPRYSLNPGTAETAIVVPIAEANAVRPDRFDRAARLHRLFIQGRAGIVNIRAQDLHSDSSDLNSEQELAHIREMVNLRAPAVPNNTMNAPNAHASSNDSSGQLGSAGRLIERPRHGVFIDVPGPSSVGSYDGTDFEYDIGVVHARTATVAAGEPDSDSDTSDTVRIRLRIYAEREATITEARIEAERQRRGMIGTLGPITRQVAERIIAGIVPDAVGVLEAVRDPDPVAAPVDREQHGEEFANRVAVQRTQFNQLHEFGRSTIEDQGIGFDLDGNPFERVRNIDLENNAIVAYFMRNNLDAGLVFGPNRLDTPVENIRRVPGMNRERDLPPHMHENAGIVHDACLAEPDPPQDDPEPSDNGFTDTTLSSTNTSGNSIGNYPEDVRRA